MNFEAGNETRKKIWSDFGAEQKLRAERKEWFLFIPLFLREREIDVKSERNFFVHVRFLKAVFLLQLLMAKRFDYDIVLVLSLFDRN